MTCSGEREKLGDMRAEQKWDYINLSDFKSTSCFTPLSYGILYISLLISLVVYAVDLFTAINLLVFDRWSGQVKPVIPFKISKWIFAACIILSWIFLVYRWLRAIRAMRSGGVAASYLDPLAVRIQSVRMGARGRGWGRFLVFAELTKSKKGTDYVALFTYFSFEAWMRILFAEGPRQAINAMTLYSVMQANLLPSGKHAASNGHTPIVQFFVNIQLLADADREQAAILFGMLFTLIIWVFSALSLAIAVLMYILFLWHHIPSIDGGLSGYCKRKIDTRVQRIVGIKVKKALAKGDTTRANAIFNGEGEPPQLKRQPTIPILDDREEGNPLLDMPLLSGQGTPTTLPSYTQRPLTRNNSPLSDLDRQPTIPDMSTDCDRPMPPSRSTTQSSALSNSSYASDAPLMGAASSMGQGPRGRTYSPAPFSRMASDRSIHSDRLPMKRSVTGSSQATQLSYNSPCRPPTAAGRKTPGPLSRQNTNMSGYDSTGRITPGFSPTEPPDRRIPPQQYFPAKTYGRRTPVPTPTNPTPIQAYEMHSHSPSPAPQHQVPTQSYKIRPQTPTSATSPSPIKRTYTAFKPTNTPTSYPIPPPNSNYTSPPPPSSARNFTLPSRPIATPKPFPPQRSGTAPLPEHTTYDTSIYDSYTDRRPSIPIRSATAGPDATGGLTRSATAGPETRGWGTYEQRRPSGGEEYC